MPKHVVEIPIEDAKKLIPVLENYIYMCFELAGGKKPDDWDESTSRLMATAKTAGRITVMLKDHVEEKEAT